MTVHGMKDCSGESLFQTGGYMTCLTLKGGKILKTVMILILVKLYLPTRDSQYLFSRHNFSLNIMDRSSLMWSTIPP